MKGFVFLLASALAVGCGSELESLKDEVCACKGDAQCLEKLEPKLRKLKEQMGDRQPTKAEEKASREMLECMMGKLE